MSDEVRQILQAELSEVNRTIAQMEQDIEGAQGDENRNPESQEMLLAVQKQKRDFLENELLPLSDDATATAGKVLTLLEEAEQAREASETLSGDPGTPPRDQWWKTMGEAAYLRELYDRIRETMIGNDEAE